MFVYLLTYRTEVRVLRNVLSDSRLGGRQRHDEQQSISGLFAHQTLSERAIAQAVGLTRLPACRHFRLRITECTHLCVRIPVRVRDEQGEEQEVGGSLVLAGVKKQLEHGGIFDQSHAELVQQEHQLRLHHTTSVCGVGGGGHTHVIKRSGSQTDQATPPA